MSQAAVRPRLFSQSQLVVGGLADRGPGLIVFFFFFFVDIGEIHSPLAFCIPACCWVGLTPPYAVSCEDLLTLTTGGQTRTVKCRAAGNVPPDVGVYAQVSTSSGVRDKEISRYGDPTRRTKNRDGSDLGGGKD